MISISEYNTLFVALSKVGSSSILYRCGKLGLWRKAEQRLPDYISHKHLQHLNAKEYIRILGEEDFESRFKFAIVKNPWALLVSNYLAACRKPGSYPERIGVYEPWRFHRWVAGDEWVSEEYPNASGYNNSPFDKDHFDNHPCPGARTARHGGLYKGYEGNQIDGARCLHHRYTYDSQLSWLTDKDGKIAVDFIGRFENINEDFHTILTKINDIHPLPKEAGGNWDLPWVNSATRGHDYKWYYNDETVERVREHYRIDIEEFGYEY